MSAAQVLTPRDELVISLEKHNTTFNKLLSLIPAKFYIAPTAEEADSKWMKNKRRRTGDEIQSHKEAKRRAKADKLDPSNNLTTDQILAGAGASASATAEAEAGPSRSRAPVPTATGSSMPAPVPAQAGTVRPLPPAASISELRARLHTKLEGFRKDRGADEGDPVSRDALEMARRQKRGEMRDKRRKERKEDRRKAQVHAATTAKGAKTQLIVPLLPKGDSVTYPSVNLPSSSSAGAAGGPSKGPIKNISNPGQALAHLEKHNAHVKALPEDKRKAVEEKERWAKALQRAGGEKVHDEEKTLKKAVKRVEKQKQKSGKEWAERKKTLEQASQASIKKRNDNIAARASAKRDKRLGVKKGAAGGKGGKKGGRPGFEGKKGKKGKK